jgi:hypothetical protein
MKHQSDADNLVVMDSKQANNFPILVINYNPSQEKSKAQQIC